MSKVRKNMKLQKELLELSAKVEDHCKIKIISTINSPLELNGEISIPYSFSCEALHPGTFKGYTIEEHEIILAQHTIFETDGNYANFEINKDHKSSRKQDSSVSDLIGKITGAVYDYSKQAYILSGEIYDKEMAIKIANGLSRFVSLRINPGYVDFKNGQKYARQLRFEELSFVRAPGDPDAKVIQR